MTHMTEQFDGAAGHAALATGDPLFRSGSW